MRNLPCSSTPFLPECAAGSLKNVKVCKYPAASIQQPVSARHRHWRWKLILTVFKFAHLHTLREAAARFPSRAKRQRPITNPNEVRQTLDTGCWLLDTSTLEHEPEESLPLLGEEEWRRLGEFSNNSRSPFLLPPGMRRRPLQNAKVCKQPATSIQQPVLPPAPSGASPLLRGVA